MRRLRHQLNAVRSRKEQLVDAFVYRQAIDQGTYEEQLDKLSEEIAIGGIAVEEARTVELDLDSILNFAEHLLANAGRLWIEGTIDRKQQLQRTLFPKGVEYSNGRFGTQETSLVFSLLPVLIDSKERKASPSSASLNRTLTRFSLNQLVAWVREMDGLRRVLA